MQYAVKFFLKSVDFETEASHYRDAAIAAAMPPLAQLCANADGQVCSPSGLPFPAFVVVERGITLHEVCFTTGTHTFHNVMPATCIWSTRS